MKEKRSFGDLANAAKIGFIPHRDPSPEYASWIADSQMRPELSDFLLKYTPHGGRSLGGFDLIGSGAMREIDSMYSTTKIGRVAVLGQCCDGSYVGVGVDTGIPTWIKKGHLEAEYLEEGLVSYPHSLEHFLIAAATDEDFPFDPFDAEEAFS
jgi:hypothetical protein